MIRSGNRWGIMGNAVVSSRGFRLLQRWRYPLSATLDALLWYPALLIAVLAQLDFATSDLANWAIVEVATIAAAIQVLSGMLSGLYKGKRTIASFPEVRLVVLSTAIATTAVFVIVAVPATPRLVPLSSILAAGAYQLLGALGIRYSVRLIVELTNRSTHDRPHRTLLFGAGEAGEQISRALLNDTHTDLDPVAFLDDDPTKQHLVLNGIRVVGTQASITAAAKRYGADTLLIALAGAPQAAINAVADAGQDAGLAVKILPSLHELTRPTLRVTDIRDLEMADFLNRDEVRIDDDAVRSYLTGRRVLVTGAGGSIGSVLCRTLGAYNPSRLIMVDHDENALHALGLSLNGNSISEATDLVLCDVRDRDALATVFKEAQPEVVFHAAAHKHVTFLEQHPLEAFKTNVKGTLNVLSTAADNGTDRFINISTDKAADPVNVLGITKRTAEQVTSAFDRDYPGRYLSVRFGNVLGSQGSVIPTFLHQIANGDPITVTDAEATRYFMTTDEAVLLVLQAGASGEGGDVLVLDMGQPVRIDDLARRLARQVAPGRECEIVYTGLRPGEKLHEALIATDDIPLGRPHERLSRYAVPPIDMERVVTLADENQPLSLLLGERQLNIDLTASQGVALAD